MYHHRVFEEEINNLTNITKGHYEQSSLVVDASKNCYSTDYKFTLKYG
jgi:hypothetical protein